MDDSISRKAAIDAISCDITITGRQNAELVASTIGMFADRIKALPPAQSGIDPQKLLQAIYNHPLLGEYEKAVITGIVAELQEDESEADE